FDGFGIVFGKRELSVFGSSRVGIVISVAVFSFGSTTIHFPRPESTPQMLPFALIRGFCLEVAISSWMYDVSVPQSHMVMTTLRSTAVGLGGAGGSSPAAMRSVQSANMGNARGPRRRISASISHPRWPVWVRYRQASSDDANPSDFMCPR